MMIRDAAEQDYDFILRLNQENVKFLSPMDANKLDFLFKKAEMLKIAEIDDSPAAFLIVLPEGVEEYDIKVYRWFSARYPSFLYVDRIVIDAPFRGKGIGRKLYGQLFDYALQKNVLMIAAGIDTVPYNEASLCFHRNMGFTEAGEQYIRNNTIKVSFQTKELRGTDKQKSMCPQGAAAARGDI